MLFGVEQSQPTLSIATCCKIMTYQEASGKFLLQVPESVHHEQKRIDVVLWVSSSPPHDEANMAYSHSRVRKTLAIVRVLTGGVFVSVGAYKVSSLEFARKLFPDLLDVGINGGAVSWVRPILEWIVSYGPARIGIMIGFVELFIGIAMVLGLAVRPAALVGMLYSAGLFLATWNQSASTSSMLQSADHQFRNVFPLLVFLLLGIGHAGETWGVGALYHHHRSRAWERDALKAAEIPVATEGEAPLGAKEPGSFEELLEQEERRLANAQIESGSEREPHP
jgi:uncharacterized membrane protein YphA (DoxX/SURF4 family)